jgi:hypothetical protein
VTTAALEKNNLFHKDAVASGYNPGEQHRGEPQQQPNHDHAPGGRQVVVKRIVADQRRRAVARPVGRHRAQRRQPPAQHQTRQARGQHHQRKQDCPDPRFLGHAEELGALEEVLRGEGLYGPHTCLPGFEVESRRSALTPRRSSSSRCPRSSTCWRI